MPFRPSVASQRTIGEAAENVQLENFNVNLTGRAVNQLQKLVMLPFSPMQKLRKILDYFGISFTLATRTASNPIPIVKEHKVILHFLARMYKKAPKPL